MSRSKIGKVRRENGRYIVAPDYDGCGGAYFKDKEAYENDWDAPCYAPEATFDYCEESDEYETHNSLLESCGYNEKLCDCLFSSLEWQCPDTWLTELDEEDYAFFWGWLKVGCKAYLNTDEAWEQGFYEVARINDAQEDYEAGTIVWLRRPDKNELSKFEHIPVCLWELSETDIKCQITQKKDNYYRNFIKPGAKVWWNDPAGESSGWFYVDNIEDNGCLWDGNAIVWLKQKRNSQVATNQVLMEELSQSNK